MGVKVDGKGAQQVNIVLNKYWERIASQYYVPDVFGRRIIESFLKKLAPIQSLIDVGCGTGELFSIFRDIPRVVGLDWQPEMLRRSKERIDRHEYTNIELMQADITQDQIRGLDFDVALTRTVLMHINPKDIVAACKNVALMADRLMIMEYYKPLHEELAWHNWHHEYPGIFKSLGCTLIEQYYRPDDVSQALFIFRSR
jgi:ubiquinone/menaquinone biosynthesis C-methylase UbiE